MTVALVEPAVELQPLTVTVTLYVPEAAVVAFVIDGFCCDEVKLLGPVQLNVAPATEGVESVSVCPAQTGPLFEAVGVAGIAFTVAVVEPAADVQPFTFTVTW